MKISHWCTAFTQNKTVYGCLKIVVNTFSLSTALCKAPVAPENGQIVCENNLLLEGVSCKSTCDEGKLLKTVYL